jgi:hypothetical protein
MKYLKKLSYIIAGNYRWFIYKQYLKTSKIIYQERKDICLACEHIKEVQILNSDKMIKVCELCGCPIESKTKVNYKLDENNKAIMGCMKKKW